MQITRAALSQDILRESSLCRRQMSHTTTLRLLPACSAYKSAFDYLYRGGFQGIAEFTSPTTAACWAAERLMAMATSRSLKRRRIHTLVKCDTQNVLMLKLGPITRCYVMCRLYLASNSNCVCGRCNYVELTTHSSLQ